MDRRTDRFAKIIRLTGCIEKAKNGPSLVIEKPALWGREKKKIEQLRTRRTDNERTKRIYDRDARVETKARMNGELTDGHTILYRCEDGPSKIIRLAGCTEKATNRTKARE